MDKFLINYKGFNFYLIHSDSPWWGSINEAGYKYDEEFVPKLTERMPIEIFWPVYYTLTFSVLIIPQSRIIEQPAPY